MASMRLQAGGKKAKKARMWQKFDQLLFATSTLDTVKRLTSSDFAELSQPVQELLASFGAIHSVSAQSWKSFLRIADERAAVNGSPDAQAIYKQSRALYDSMAREQVGQTRVASHWSKRMFVHQLGLNASPYSLQDVLAARKEETRSGGVPSPSLLGHIKIEYRTPADYKPAAKRTYFTEVVLPETPEPHVLVTENTGYRIVEPDESVIFISHDDSGNHVIELAVLRGVACEAPFSEALYKWMEEVVNTACDSRRDQRPSHPGHMAQVGVNMGPRHARVLGYAVSFRKKLSDEVKEMQDQEVIAAVSLMWALLRVAAPAEITQHLEESMQEAGVPKLGTRNVKGDTGYTLLFDGTEFSFANAERAPPEAYLSRGYVAWSHVDPAYALFALSFCVGRHIGIDTPPELPGGGASFVDDDLKVVVKQAVGTLIPFRPQHRHGTSLAWGATNFALTLAFSQRIEDALKELKEKGLELAPDGTVQSITGAIEILSSVGEGNPSG